jgi:Spy/CpxP family protein refolding chaperone
MFWQFRRFGFRGHHGMGRGPFSFIAKAGVELTDEQVEKLAEIKGDGFIDFAGRGADSLPAVRSIVRALCKSDIDKDEVRSLHKELQAKRNQMGDAFVERIIATAEVLTPEQRKQVRMYMLRAALGLNRHEEEHECDDPPPHQPGRRR